MYLMAMQLRGRRRCRRADRYPTHHERAIEAHEQAAGALRRAQGERRVVCSTHHTSELEPERDQDSRSLGRLLAV